MNYILLKKQKQGHTNKQNNKFSGENNFLFYHFRNLIKM